VVLAAAQAFQFIVGGSEKEGLFIHFGKIHPNKSTLFGGFSSQSSFLESKWCQTNFISLSDRMKECTDKEISNRCYLQGLQAALHAAPATIPSAEWRQVRRVKYEDGQVALEGL
jgi:hypothetical protein